MKKDLCRLAQNPPEAFPSGSGAECGLSKENAELISPFRPLTGNFRANLQFPN